VFVIRASALLMRVSSVFYTLPVTLGADTLFAGRYAILGKLGSGGFGTVYRAYDQHLRIEVALKVTNATVTDPALLQRFEREARVIAKLNHENITKIFDFGVHEGTPFYAMEFIPGDSLQRVLEVSRVLAPRAAARIVRDVALALHHAHLAGITHRDVKPQNIIVQPRQSETKGGGDSISSSRGVLSDYRVVLTDFGLAKDAGAQTKLSVTGEVMGTPHFMPPEQAMGESAQIGPPADVYSLGVTLYVLLSGAYPFEGNSFPEILANIMTREPRSLHAMAPRVPTDLCAIVQKATEREIAHRYSSALALAQDCENFLKGEPISAKPPPLHVKARRLVRRHVALFASVASAVIVAAVALGVFAVYLPWRAAQLLRQAHGEFVAVFEDEKARIEGEAADALRQARASYAAGEFERAATEADRLVSRFGPYARRETFPRGFLAQGWHADFEQRLPFRIPVVEAELIVADAYERRHLVSEATRFHLKAHFEPAQPGDPDATFELAYFFLRNRKFDEAARFFRKATRSPAWSSYGLGFALAGAGRFDDAARVFEKVAPPADFPLRREFVEGDLVPLYSLPPTADVVAEALHLCDLFGGRKLLADDANPGPLAATDLDADGKQELLIGTAAGIDVVTPGGTRHLAGPNLKGVPLATGDFDRDGKPELLVGVPGGFRVFKIDGERLTLLFEVTGDKGPRGDALWVKSVMFADIDGDRTPEILMHAHQEFRIYRAAAGAWTCIGAQRLPSTDVADMFVQDLDGDGRLEIVMVTGTWGPTAFRAWVYHGDDVVAGRTPAPQIAPVGRTSSSLLEVPGTKSFLFTTCVWDLDVRTQNSIYGEIGLDRLMGLCKVTVSGGTISAPQLVWGRRADALTAYSSSLQQIVERDRSYAFVHLATDGELRVIRLAGSTWRYLPLDPSEARPYLVCDLDGDGDAELVERKDGKLWVRGLARAAASVAEAESQETPGNARSVAFQDAMLGLSIYLERGREADAVRYLEDDLVPQFPEFEKELRFRVADCWQTLRQWDRLLEALAKIRSRFYLPASELGELDRRSRWVREMLELRETVVLDDRVTLLTNAPLRFRIEKGVVRAFSNSVSPSFLAVPIESDEHSQVVTARFKLPRFDYTATFALGVSDGLGTFGTIPFDSWSRTFMMATGGAGGRQGMALALSSTGSTTTLANPPMVPGPDSLDLAVEYVRDAGVLDLQLDRGREVVARQRVSVAFLNPPCAAYLVLRTGGGGMAGDGLWGEMEIERFAVKSAGGAVARAWKPQTLRDRFLRGGGRYVRGDFDGAAQDYGAVLRTIDANRWDADELYGMEARTFTRTVSFYLAFAERANGTARLVKLFDEDFREVLLLVKRNHLGMSEDDRALLRDAFWQAMEHRGVDETLAVLRDAVTIAPSGGLPVYETLFFVDPPDPAPAERILSNVERLSDGRDVRLACGVLRLRAHVLRMRGRTDEALKTLGEALKLLDDRSLDDFDRYGMKRSIEVLMRAWKSE